MLCTSSDETGPLILIEAMALGKPILSTKVGVVGENLITDEDALFVEPGDAIALAGADPTTGSGAATAAKAGDKCAQCLRAIL